MTLFRIPSLFVGLIIGIACVSIPLLGCSSSTTTAMSAAPASAPVFTPAAGTYTSTQSVTLTDATPGTAIYYTTDGSNPTTASKLFTGAIAVSASTTVQAVAIAAGYSLSGVASAIYTITPPAATPTFSIAAGTYTSTQSVTLADATVGATIYYTTDGSTPTIASARYTAAITVSATTTLQAVAITAGYSLSGVASAVFTIVPPAATPAFSPAAGTFYATQNVTISDTTPGAILYYTTDGSTPTTASTKYTAAIAVSTTTTVQAIATATGYTASAVASSFYTILPSAPTISLATGTYTSTQSVILTDATASAKIYYTTDGTKPTASSTLYTGAISVTTSETLNAIAVLSGQLSAVSTATYIINLPPASLSAYAGSNQSVQIGIGFGTGLQVQVLAALSRPLSGITVSFTVPSSGPAATLSATSCTTSSTGLCSITARANSSLGTFTISASTAALTAAFTLTNTGLHSYVVTVATDGTTGVASNCLDEALASGSGNTNCSLRDALAAAATKATATQNATITFAQTSSTIIALVNGSLAIPSYTTIQGGTSGAGSTLTNLITVDGNNSYIVFTEASGITQAVLNNLTITHGSTSSVGGGLYMQGSLAVNNSAFTANTAALSGGAVSNNGGTLTIFGSTFTSNSITVSNEGYGGGVDNFGGGTVTVSNSTFYGNQGYYGGGLYSSGTATIVSSTFSGNTASYGAGIYNKGSMTISSSIVNGNSNENCGGLYCNALWAYATFAAATPAPVDSASVTIAFNDSAGNFFSQTASYGIFSTPASFASTFGPYFFYNTSGLDTAAIAGQSFGTLLVITPENGATLSPFVITNPGKSFTVTQTSYPLLLSVNNNVYDISASQVNLSALGNNGGPTPTMLPLTGSAALCVIAPSSATGTDQRGQPRTTVVGSTTCQDAGAVQTNK
jgi:hypothetical protein